MTKDNGTRSLCALMFLVLAMAPGAGAQAPVSGKNVVTIRGQQQDIYYFPPAGVGERKPKILFAPGDGGWRGFAITIAETLASWGYPVYGIDTRRYLMSFTGRTTLRESDVVSDFRSVADWIRQGREETVVLAGWSEGAGLGLLAASDSASKKVFGGLVLIGLGESNVLGWRWTDDITYITKRAPNEPSFRSVEYLPKAAPIPTFMIHSQRDEYAPLEAAKRMFGLAGEPKRLKIVDAQNHRFDGNRPEFFRTLKEAFEWMTEHPR